ncbi:hypothetical protein FRC20_009480 [Serendipita sp. 405]|nr:hypothetical protein FRC20_009480 [Serendipita sp. 405]
MSRAVGWAYPGLFRHYALYEMSSGFGPMLWAYLEITGVSDLWKTRMTPKLRTYVLSALYVALCWLDNAPWTYSVTIILTTTIHLAQTVLDSRQWQDISTTKPAILSQFRLRVGGAVIALLLVSIPYSLLPILFPPARVLAMPQTPFPPSPLLDILILSFPRPNGALILNTTISSYLPHLSNDIRLSLYTYSTDHPVFQEMQTAFQDHDITFHVNRDPRPDALDGHYLHLSEAFRWQNERGAQKAEWTMLVEDDFPICGADAGWEAVVRVMEILEGGRPSETGDHKRLGRIPKRRGGFVGTGGSGLILHRSLLPTLIYILRTHADRTPRLPAGVPPRPVDVIVQDCLLGKDPMCPPWREEGLVITSRLVMDHIGGLASTNKYKPPNSDQWRCGWRHPFHGLPEVEVVPVEGLW